MADPPPLVLAWSVDVLRIVPYPHPALRYESRPVTRIDDDLRATVREMFGLMYAANGIGLAANQVGIPLRFFILNLTADAEQPDQERVFINPEIVKRHSSEENEEGCLSLPGLYGKVKRARKIRVQAYDLGGNPIEVEADDLLGRAIQHESDHLDGKLFIDYLGPIARTTSNAKVKEIEAGYRKAQAEGLFPDDDEIRRQLDEVARSAASA
jgi:peptide deformylase